MTHQNAWDALHLPGNKADAAGQSPIFVVLIVGVLLVGVAGVFLFGPSRAVEAVRGLIGNPKKTASMEVATPEVVRPPAPVRIKRRAKEKEVRPSSAEPVQTAVTSLDPPPSATVHLDSMPRARTSRIAVGTTRAELLALWGAPDIKTTTMVDGRFRETFSYGYRPSSPARLVMLENGRVISTGDATTP